MGSGLCRAIAARMGIDVVLVRVAFALLALSGGLGIALYAWGTALTRGATGVRPIDSLLPSFGRWSGAAQKATVILSTLAGVSLVSSVTSLPWGPGVILVALLVLARRSRRGGSWPPPSPPRTAFHPPSGPGPVVSDEALVADWRSRMHAAVGPARGPDPLPVVDLYSPEPTAAPPAVPRPRAAWLIGLAILAAMVAAGAVVAVVLGGPMMGLGAALVTGGSLVVLYSAVARSRRVPRPLIGVLVFAMVLGGWLAPRAAGPGVAPSADAAVLSVHVVGQDRVIDLREDDLLGIDHIDVEAIASDVTVLLPGSPESVTSEQRLGEVTSSFSEESTPLDITVSVDATLSSVTLEETP